MENQKLLKELLMQVKKPFYAVNNQDEIKLITEDNDFFINDFKNESFSQIEAFVPAVTPTTLGDENFKKRHEKISIYCRSNG